MNGRVSNALRLSPILPDLAIVFFSPFFPTLAHELETWVTKEVGSHRLYDIIYLHDFHVGTKTSFN